MNLRSVAIGCREYHGKARTRSSSSLRIARSTVARILDIRAGPQETENMKELIQRLFQLDFIKGMGVTFRTQNPKNIYTEQYPLERPLVAERYRGAPRLNDNPGNGRNLLHRLQSLRSGLSRSSHRRWLGARRRHSPQSPHHLYV